MTVSVGVRLLPLLLLALLLAACGSSVAGTGAPASSGRESESASGEGTASGPGEPAPEPVDESDLQPPPIILVSEYGRQEAVRGSYCVDYVDEETGQGSGMCADSAMPTYPDAVTSVAPGDRVTFVISKAVFKRDSVVTVRPLGCTDEVTQGRWGLGKIRLEPGTGEHEWAVDLEHGAYQLDVFARFQADDGRSGDVSGSLGLTVAGPKKWDALGVGEITARMPVCDVPT